MRDILDDGFDRLDGREPVQRIAALEPSDVPTLLRRPPAIDSESDRSPFEEAVKPRHRSRSGEQASWGDANGRNRASGEKSRWQVRVGQFREEKQAEQRLGQARKAAPYALRHGKAAISRHSHRGKKSYVAYFKGLAKDDAALACKELGRKRLECRSLMASN